MRPLPPARGFLGFGTASSRVPQAVPCGKACRSGPDVKRCKFLLRSAMSHTRRGIVKRRAEAGGLFWNVRDFKIPLSRARLRRYREACENLGLRCSSFFLATLPSAMIFRLQDRFWSAWGLDPLGPRNRSRRYQLRFLIAPLHDQGRPSELAKNVRHDASSSADARDDLDWQATLTLKSGDFKRYPKIQLSCIFDTDFMFMGVISDHFWSFLGAPEHAHGNRQNPYGVSTPIRILCHP